ncbi:hypothetical protein B0H14DRAFT_3599385 [Mycena olivaceomarginata]|nr:hypothetical protein B0H14DRAFT_3599385 [Mycena olivaceomarginata]
MSGLTVVRCDTVTSRLETIIVDSDTDNNSGPEFYVSKPPKPSKASTTQPPKPKATKKATTSDDDVDDSASPTQTEDDQKSNESLSGEDDGTGDCPQLIQRTKSTPTTHDNLLDFEDTDIPKVHRHQMSSSSGGSMPPETDVDLDVDLDWKLGMQPDLHQSLTMTIWRKMKYVLTYLSTSADSRSYLQSVKGPQRLTTQQRKYDQEKPAIHRSKVLHDHGAEKSQKVLPETGWPRNARIVFPATGGQIKLLEQNPVLQGILHSCIERSLYDLAFKDGYESSGSRPGYVSKLVRRVAKKVPGPDGLAIEKCAKNDLKFCGRLAPIFCTRGGNVRSGLRKGAISKVATHYELNKPGITPSHIRQIVQQLLRNQRYIFPYAGPAPLHTAEPAEDSGTATAGPKAAKVVVAKTFVTDLPFHPSAVVDLIQDGWWSGSRSFGFKHIKDLKSHQTDRPTEVVLPDPMICLAATNVWAALLAYQTGHYVPATEFNQARLEGTYRSLLEIMKGQCSGSSAKLFNKRMHDLYLKVSGPQTVVTSTAGSANNIISLGLESE